MSHWTVIRPPEPSETTALLARALWTAKLMLLELGARLPAEYSGRSPRSVASTTVTLTATALAVDGIPQRPVTGKLRVVLAPSAGPPEGPTGLRVSATRHGVTVKKLEGFEWMAILVTKAFRLPKAPNAAWSGLAVGKSCEFVWPVM